MGVNGIKQLDVIPITKRSHRTLYVVGTLFGLTLQVNDAVWVINGKITQRVKTKLVW